MARPIAKDHDEKRHGILAIAAEVFARDGISRSSMNGVATAGGISKANIYHYYASKDELVFGILDDYLSALRDRICGINIQQGSPEDNFLTVVTEFLLAYEGMDHQHKIQHEGLPLLPKAQQEILKAYQRDMVGIVETILVKGFPKELKKDKSQLRVVAMSVFGMLNWYYQWNPKATRKDRMQYAETVCSITFRGVRGL